MALPRMTWALALSLLLASTASAQHHRSVPPHHLGERPLLAGRGAFQQLPVGQRGRPRCLQGLPQVSDHRPRRIGSCEPTAPR